MKHAILLLTLALTGCVTTPSLAMRDQLLVGGVDIVGPGTATVTRKSIVARAETGGQVTTMTEAATTTAGTLKDLRLEGVYEWTNDEGDGVFRFGNEASIDTTKQAEAIIAVGAQQVEAFGAALSQLQSLMPVLMQSAETGDTSGAEAINQRIAILIEGLRTMIANKGADRP